MIFADLKKAYDSVPQEALWAALRKLDVPDQLVTIIISFHESIKVKIQVVGELLDEIEIENSLRQGCTMAPTLFNLYECAVAESCMSRVCDKDGVGMCVFHKLARPELFRRYTMQE